jgi:hypothetical protein
MSRGPVAAGIPPRYRTVGALLTRHPSLTLERFCRLGLGSTAIKLRICLDPLVLRRRVFLRHLEAFDIKSWSGRMLRDGLPPSSARTVQFTEGATPNIL